MTEKKIEWPLCCGQRMFLWNSRAMNRKLIRFMCSRCKGKVEFEKRQEPLPQKVKAWL